MLWKLSSNSLNVFAVLSVTSLGADRRSAKFPSILTVWMVARSLSSGANRLDLITAYNTASETTATPIQAAHPRMDGPRFIARMTMTSWNNNTVANNFILSDIDTYFPITECGQSRSD